MTIETNNLDRHASQPWRYPSAVASRHPAQLTRNEERLFQVLLQSAGRLVTAAEIEQAVWDGRYVTDESHRQLLKNLRRKLEGSAYWVETIRGRGHMLHVRLSTPRRLLRLISGGRSAPRW